MFAGLAAQALIVASLWWWEDLNDELEAADAPVGRAFGAWRRAATVAAAGTSRYSSSAPMRADANRPAR